MVRGLGVPGEGAAATDVPVGGDGGDLLTCTLTLGLCLVGPEAQSAPVSHS